MSGLVWCCCSAGRPEALVRKTIATLERGGFRSSLFVVVPTEELVTYQTALAGAPIHTILLHTQKGLTRQRAFFRQTMLPGTEIVFIDDDVTAVKIRTPSGLQHCRQLEMLANFVFQAMTVRSDDCLLAGVYPVANRDWMTATCTEDNAYIVGALYFLRNDERVVEPDEQELEDYARQLSEQAAGRPTLRFNWIGIQTQYFKNTGGLQTTRTHDLRNRVSHELVSRYPTLIRWRNRRDGTPDLKFLSRPTAWTAAPFPSVAPATASAAPPPLSVQDAPSDQPPE